MLVKFDELEVLKVAEELADGLWEIVVKWDNFAKNSIGQQLVRAVDSIGADIEQIDDTDLFSQDDIDSLSKTSNSINQPNQLNQPNQP